MLGDWPENGEVVIRRVGGLEESEAASALEEPVIRRVGGLEGSHPVLTGERKVIRRVGGLEDSATYPRFFEAVIRRVGGLEVSGRTPSHFIGITPFQDQLPTTPKRKATHIKVSRLSFGVIRRLRMVLHPARCRRTCAFGMVCPLP